MSRKAHKSAQLESTKSLGSDFQTSWVNIQHLDNVGFIVNCNNVSDNTGTFSVQVRSINKETNAASSPVTLTLSSVPTLADADQDLGIDLANVPYDQIRLAFTAAGGTPDGDVDVWLTTKSGG